MRTEGDYLIGYETQQGRPICLACSRHHDPTDYERYYSSDTDSGEVVCWECGRHMLDAAAINLDKPR